MLPVFIPELPDCEYNYGEKPLTAEQISQFARDYEEWLIVDLEHEFLYTGQVIGTVIESHVTTEPVTVKFIDGTPREYPAGTWFVTLKITNQDVIQGIHDEHYTGGSATTIERDDADKLRKILNVPIAASTKSKIKRIPISEIKDPVVITISIVHSPCVPLAKFCSLKNNNKDVSTMTEEINEEMNTQIEEETKGFITRIGEIFGSVKAEKTEEADDEKKEPEFLTVAEFTSFKGDMVQMMEAMNAKIDTIAAKAIDEEEEKDEEDEVPVGLTEEEEKELERLLAKKEASTKATDSEEKPEDEEEEEEEEEELKASSKSTPVHDTGKKAEPQMSDSQIVYSIMGRTSTGSAKRQ